MINNNIINVSGHYFCFVYFPEKKSEVLKPFLSYYFVKNNKNLHVPFLDFDRVIPIPDSVEDENVRKWIEENWKTGSNSFDSSVDDDGIVFTVEKSAPTYLVKKLSEITKHKLKLLYVSIDENLCGEYLAYPDKDGVHMIYKPFIIEAPPQIMDEIQHRFGINFTLSDNLKQMVDTGIK